MVEESGSRLGVTMRMLPRSLVLSLTKDDGRRIEDPWSWPVDEDYWLGHCQGFRVDGPEGRVGVVEHVVYGSHLHRPDVVWVRFGGWRARAVSVPVTDVLELRPHQERLVVRCQAGASRRLRSGLGERLRGWRARTAAWGGTRS
jgi:hypothetical protein